ncbi:hypothetical protein Tco_0943244 [Tanacetum coccineum]
MSTHEQQTSTIPTSVVRNTRGKSGPQNFEEPASNEALRELCDKNYHQLLPLIAEKMQKEKEQQDKLKAVKARLAMPTWCHMFNSTLTGNARVWFDKLPKESIDSYEDLRAAIRASFTLCIRSSLDYKGLGFITLW